MATRTALLFAIGDIIESGPPTVTPSYRRNASPPNSASSGSIGGINIPFKRSVSNSFKVNGRSGEASRGRPTGHCKQDSNFMSDINRKKGIKNENIEVYEDAQSSVNSINPDKKILEYLGNVSDTENSSESSDFVFSTTLEGRGGKRSGKKMARMKPRRVSTSSPISVKYPGEISPITFIQSTRHASPIKPKESLMKPSRSSQGEEKLASLSDSVTDMASVCNGTSHISSRLGPC
jgi:hypothetical protein